MQTRITAATDIATFIIFDPASIPADAINPKRPLEAIETLTADGSAICYSFASDGEADFAVLVDEEPADEWVARRRNGIDDVLLRVPSGRMIATGYEDLCGRGERKYSPETFVPEMGDTAMVPPGDYAVEAFEIDWGEDVVHEITARAIPGDEKLETIFGTSMGCVVWATILILPAVLGILWKQSGFNVALKVGAYAFGFELVFWLIAILVVKYSKAWRRMNDLRKEVESQHPGAVLVLRSLCGAEAQREFKIGKFGEGFSDN